ncbi:MAG: carbonic anhydrase [Candidatus Tectimicrobiota bacterium]
MALEDLIKQNRTWAAAQIAQDPDFFARHVAGQHPRVLWLGCADSRVPAEAILGCGPGDVFIHRNIANLIAHNDISVAAVIQYATAHLHIPDIIVCGHFGCGGIAAVCSEQLIAGYVGDWLTSAAGAKRAVDLRLGAEKARLTQEEYLRQVVQENVRLQVNHLSHLTVVRQRWQETPGLPRLHGWVYDIGTGHVSTVVENITTVQEPYRP